MDMNLIVAELARPKPGCWATRLTGDPAELLAAIEAYEEDGGFVDRRATSSKLAEWGVEATDNAVKRHLNRDCKCRPRQ